MRSTAPCPMEKVRESMSRTQNVFSVRIGDLKIGEVKRLPKMMRLVVVVGMSIERLRHVSLTHLLSHNTSFNHQADSSFSRSGSALAS